MTRILLLTVAPVESPAQYLRDALRLLIEFEAANPAVWHFTPELSVIQVRLFQALFLLEGDKS